MAERMDASGSRLRELHRELSLMDRDLLQRVLTKKRTNRRLARDEVRTCKRFEELKAAIAFWSLAQALPKVDYEALAGQHRKVLHHQARTYGIPLIADTIDLAAVIAWLHQALAAGRVEAIDERPLCGHPTDLDRFRKAKADLAELELLKARGQIVAMDAAQEWAGAMATVLRRAGQKLSRRHGPAAHKILADAIDEVERKCKRMFGH